jgi:uncharacterized protein (DUF924 family)
MRIAAANPQAEASAVVDFWRAAGPKRWFAKDADFDRRFREGFLSLHEAAMIGDLADWLATPNAALALVLLLDQFPRNAFRGTPRMYASDAMARQVAAAGHPPRTAPAPRGTRTSGRTHAHIRNTRGR